MLLGLIGITYAVIITWFNEIIEKETIKVKDRHLIANIIVILFKYKPSASSAAAELNDVACFTWRVMQDVPKQSTGTNSSSASPA